MSKDWFSNYDSNPRVKRTESFDSAVELIEEQTEGVIGEDITLSMRGTMTSIGPRYQVPGLDNTEDEGGGLQEDSPFDLSDIEPRGGNQVPDFIANIDEALQWGNEKGPETDWVRTAGYGGEKAHIDHCWSAMDSTPHNLNRWNVPEANQAMTRPVLFVYDNDIVDHTRGGYDTGLPANPEERSQAIEYVVIVDQDPTSDDYEI